MAKIPKEVQDFMKGKMGWVATASPDGVPNATPKGSVQVIDDEHLVFADLFSRKTRENLLKNPKVLLLSLTKRVTGVITSKALPNYSPPANYSSRWRRS